MPRYGRSTSLRDAHDRQPRPKPKPLPKKKDDAVVGFLKKAARVVKDFSVESATSPAKETYKFFSPDAKKLLEYAGFTGPTGPMGGRFGAPIKASRNLGAISDPLKETILQAGKFTVRPGTKGDDFMDAFLKRLPRSYGNKDPFTRGGKLFHLPEEATGWTGDPGVGGRIPWLVQSKTGRTAVGRPGESHGSIGHKLRARGVEIRRRPLGEDMVDPEEWLEGWLSHVGAPGEEPWYSAVLSARGLNQWAKPQDERGLRALIDYLTEPVTDAQVFSKGRTAFAERQGSRANDLLKKLGGPMTPEEMARFARSESKRRKR